MKTPSSRAFTSLRQTGVALCCAAAVALIGSRINRPASYELLTSPPRAADEVLPEVTLDMRSLRLAIASIQKSAKSRIVIDDTLPPDDQAAIANLNASPTIPLHNVRLGAVLSIVLEQLPQGSSRWEFHEENGVVILCAPGKSHMPVYPRMYDVRDLAAHVHPSTAPIPAVTGSGIFGSPATNPETADQLLKGALQMSNGAQWEPWGQGWDMQVWSGYVIATASSDGHRALEELLFTLRQSIARRANRRPQ